MQILQILRKLTKSHNKRRLIFLALQGIYRSGSIGEFLQFNDHFVEFLDEVIIVWNNNARRVLCL